MTHNHHSRSLSTSLIDEDIREIRRATREKEKTLSAISTCTLHRSKSIREISRQRNRNEDSDDYSTDDARVLLSAKKLLATNIRKESFDRFISRRRNALESQRDSISIYTSPLLVITYFILYMIHQIRVTFTYLLSRTDLLAGLFAFTTLLYIANSVQGFHTTAFNVIKSTLWWYTYWIALGIASAIGLGTGLHTFVLFLGPHIVDVTLTAFECGNIDFAVRGEHAFICRRSSPINLTIIPIFRHVMLESFFWGLGTAIGELPPYFISRAAALSGSRSQELAHIESLLSKEPNKVTMKERVLYVMHQVMTKLGFWGIFLCASIPNPLFDLAGITCGHFLVPFSTFFGATMLGKAVVKSSFQTMIVIILFSPNTLDKILEYLRPRIPFLASLLDKVVGHQVASLNTSNKGSSTTNLGITRDNIMGIEMLEGIQEMEMGGFTTAAASTQQRGPSVVSLLWNTIVFLMLFYFLLSIIESLARAHLARLHEEEIVELIKKTRPKIDKIDKNNQIITNRSHIQSSSDTDSLETMESPLGSPMSFINHTKLISDVSSLDFQKGTSISLMDKHSDKQQILKDTRMKSSTPTFIP